MASIPGLDVILQYAQQLRQAIESHPRYVLDYPTGFRHGVDASAELEMVYTPNAQ